MAQIKLIATDLDGTFLDNYETPNAKNIQAMRACQAAGIAVCACTGRNWYSAREIFRKVNGFDRYCVINNGTAILDTKTEELRYRNRFDPAVARAVLEIALSYPNADVGVSGTYVSHLLNGRANPRMLKNRQRNIERDPAWAGRMVLYDTLDELLEGCADDMQRVNLGVNIYEEGNLDEVYQRINEITGIEITTSGHGNMEITPKAGNKAEALSVLADIYGAQPENVMAFGDSYNDMHMLMWAGTGVAMGNADERLKSIADVVTDCNTNAGVAKAMVELALHQQWEG